MINVDFAELTFHLDPGASFGGCWGGGGGTALPKPQVAPPSLNLPPTSPKPQEVTAAVFPLFLPKFKCVITLTSHFSYILHFVFLFFL